jgi:pimeloyl-ACP methyl ester carboxylesterase
MLFYKTHTHTTTSPWVVFVHGAGGSSAIWYKQIRSFKANFNVLLVDLRGHGRSPGSAVMGKNYNFETISADVLQVLDHLNIKKAHFVGVSLGTIIIRQLAEMAPERVQSMILAGAIAKLDIRSRFFVGMGNTFKNLVPYLWLYKLFAFVIMPRKNHAESRSFFVNEARKLARQEFLRWYKLTGQLRPLLKRFEVPLPGIPTLYVMGRQDHMFLPTVQDLVKRTRQATLEIVEECGHVVTMEQPAVFNEYAIRFILAKS